jgi:hypothetical protein
MSVISGHEISLQSVMNQGLMHCFQNTQSFCLYSLENTKENNVNALYS